MSDISNANYNQIDMNAIKNTKLFQKFMQNKSGLILKQNNNQSSLHNHLNNNHQIQINKKQDSFDPLKINNNLKNSNQINEEDKSNSTKNKQFINKQKQYIYGIYHHEKPVIKQKKQINTVKHSPYQKNQQYQYEQKYHYTKNNMNKKQYEQNEQILDNYSKVEPYNNQVNIQQHSNILKQQLNKNNRRKRDFDFKNINVNNNNQTNKYQIQEKQIIKQEKFKKWDKIQQKNNQNDLHTNQLSMDENIKLYKNIQNHDNQRYKNNYDQSFNYQKLPNNITQNNSFNYQKSTNIQVSTLLSKPVEDIDDIQYKKKYEKILLKYQDLKREMKNQNKTRKMQLNQWQQQIQIIKQKLYEVQSREDTLVIQNQRLKQKYQYQSNLKTKAQQQSKQLSYKIKQLQDMLNMKQIILKQKNDQVNHWKNQLDQTKSQNNSLKITIEKKIDQFNMLSGDYHIIKKQRDNKDYLLDDLRKNISILVEQNSAAKDQLFTLVTKLYQLQQQNQTLKADLKRQIESSNINYADMRGRIQSINYERPQRQEPPRIQRYQPIKHERTFQKYQIHQQIFKKSLNQHQKPQYISQRPTRARGQFARQRGQLNRQQKVQRVMNNQKGPRQNLNKTFEQTNKHPQKPISINNNKVNRIQEISEQLQKIKDMKAMNGAIRRKKIQLQRQLQQLQGHFQ